MDAPSVELVTLSDSLTSPVPKPRRKPRNADQGATNVVCLDSDTESDGSYVHAMVSRVALKVSNDGVCGGFSDECKKEKGNWLGLHKCSNKPWSANHSLSPDVELKKDVPKTVNAIDQMSNFNLVALTKKSTQGVDLSDKPDVDDVGLEPREGAAHLLLCSSFSPVDQCTGDSFSYNSTMLSVSFHKSSPPPIRRVQGVKSSPNKDSSDCSLPAWDDHLKGILSKLETSKADVQTANHSQQKFEQRKKREYSDHDSADDDYHGDYSFLRTKLRKCDAATTVNGEHTSRKYVKKSTKKCSREADQQSAKATAKTLKASTSIVTMDINDSTNAVDKEVDQLNKKEKQANDREGKEARKQQLKMEREMLRKEKQEEKKRQQELKKQRTEEEKKRKEELKAEAVERRKVEKEREKWEKGKFALQNITALVDTQILEAGLIGGHLLTRFAEKGFKYHLVKNPVKKTVVWQMKLPSKESQIDSQEDSLSQDSHELKTSKKVGPQLSLESVDVSYVLIVLEANEFLEMITEDTLDKHIRSVQKVYPGFTLCYLINKLMWCLHKREQKQYKASGDNWSRPPVEQILAKLVTSYDGVHSRLCTDEAEVSEHIVGLTRSLAECPFKRKLTPLSLCANGDHVVKNDPNNDVIKRDIWLKALVALPKVSSSCAIAIARKYPSMSALFEAYLDQSKTVHEKEHLLQDLVKEGLLAGDHNRRIGPVCSKRIFRILMAEQGNLHTDDVEEGADAFRD